MTIPFRCAKCRQLLHVPAASVGKNARCPKCELLMRVPTQDPIDNRAGLPWEQSPQKSLAKFIATARLVAFQPSTAFSQMKQRGRIGEAMFYSGIGQFIGIAGMEFWHITLTYLLGPFLGLEAAMLQQLLTGMGLMALSYLFVGVPLLATLGNLISGSVLHFCLILCGGSKHPFGTSLRIACYGQSSLTWLMLIPGGVFVVGVWSIGVNILAVHQAHEVPMGRAVLTVLLPMIVVMALAVVMIILLGVSLVALLSQV